MKPLNTQELIYFSEQISMILRSGIPVLEGLTIMAEDCTGEDGEALLRELSDQMENGQTFHQALSSTGAFPSYFLNMAEIGEQSGRLDEVMEALSRYYSSQAEMISSIRSAILYPFAMLGMMIVIVIVLITKVMPVFEQVFRQLGSGLTGFSLGIYRLGQGLGRCSFLFVGIAVVLALLILFFAFTHAGRAKFARMSASLPFTRKLSVKLASARFASGMALCLKSGLDTDASLEMVSRLTEHPVLQQRTEVCRSELAQGQSFDSAVKDSGLFTGLQARLISVGFKTGSLDQVMEKLAAQYEEDASNTITHIISVVEPTLVAVLSVLVGLVLLSVMLPLMGIMSGLG